MKTKVTCPELHIWKAAGLGCEPRQPESSYHHSHLPDEETETQKPVQLPTARAWQNQNSKFSALYHKLNPWNSRILKVIRWRESRDPAGRVRAKTFGLTKCICEGEASDIEVWATRRVRGR